MATEQIIVEYIAQVEGMKAQLKTVEGALKKVEAQGKESATNTAKSFNNAGESIKDAAKGIAVTLGLAFGAAKVIEFGKESVKAFLEAEVNANKLKFAITKIGGEGGAAFEKLIKQSERLQNISIFSDDDIQRSQTQLATLGLNSKQIEEIIPKILDLASATGQDLGSATQSIIQGINGQTRSLKAVGLGFDATSDKTKNLSILTEKLTKFQGASAEALETVTGKTKRLENAVDNIKESIGEWIVGTGTGLLDFYDQLSGKSDEVTARLLKNSMADKVNEQQTKILEGAKKSEAARLFAIEETEKRIIELAQQGVKTQSLLGKTIVKDKLDSNKALLKELQEMNKPLTNGLGVDPEIAKNAQKAKEEALKLEGEKLEALKKLNADAADSFLEDTLSEESKIAKAKEDAANAEYETQVRIVEAGENKIKQTKADSEKEITKNKDDEAKKRKAIEESGFEFIKTSLDAIGQIQQNGIQEEINGINEKRDKEITALDDQLKRKVISQEQYDKKKAQLDLTASKKESELKRKAFEAEKQSNVIKAVVNTAVAVAKTFAEWGYPAGIPLAALALASGAVQIAVINSQPTPKFAKGGLVGGKLHSEGGTLIEAQRGEFVNTIEATNKHKGLLEAMNKGKESKYIQDFYIAPILRAQLKKQSELKESSFASNIANSLALNSNFKDGNLLDSMKQSRKQERENALFIAKALSKSHNSRRP